MAHCKSEDLKDLTYLLKQFRNQKNLKEKSLGCFYLKSKSVLHFHIKADRRYAHVYSKKMWIEVDIAKDLPEAKLESYFKKIIKLLDLPKLD